MVKETTMAPPDFDYFKIINDIKECRECFNLTEPVVARPLFQNSQPKYFDILFILEAPNKDDTINPKKGYLTYDINTDPTGNFFRDLFTQELKLDISELFVTNSVLCLPRKNNEGKFPVKSEMLKNCNKHLKNFILSFNPKIVCPVGGTALKATNMIEKHNITKMKDAVAKEINWFGRILFPLFHTGRLARNKKNGRPIELQREDWRKLSSLYSKVKSAT